MARALTLSNYEVNGKDSAATLVYDFSDPATSWTQESGNLATIATFEDSPLHNDVGSKTFLMTLEDPASNKFNGPGIHTLNMDLSASDWLTFKLGFNRDDTVQLRSKFDIKFFLGSGGNFDNNLISARFMGGDSKPLDAVFSLHLTDDFTPTGSIDLTAVTSLRIEIRTSGVSTAATPHKVYWDAFYSGLIASTKIMINFDDNSLTAKTEAFDNIMEPVGMVGTMFINKDTMPVGADDDNYYGTTSALTMQTAGWQIASHGTTHDLYTDETEAEQLRRVVENEEFLEAQGFGNWTTDESLRYYAYVGGGQTTYLIGLLGDRGYNVARTVEIGTTGIYNPPGAEHPLTSVRQAMHFRTIQITSDLAAYDTAAEILAIVDDCILRGTSLSIYGHEIVDSPTSSTEFATAEFQLLIDGLVERTVDVVTFKEYFEGLDRPRPLTSARVGS